MSLPPPPTNANPGSYAWSDWYYKLVKYYSTTGSVPWEVVGKTGSNLTDIVTRRHDNLQAIQGGVAGEYYHLSAAQIANVGLIPNLAPKNSPAFTTSVGFNGSAPIGKPTVTGAKGGNAALASLLTALANYGLITDSTT